MAQQSEEVKSREMGSGFCSYTPFHQTHLVSSPTQLQGLESTSMPSPMFLWQNNTNRSVLVEEESSTRCVFPCEGNEKPSQGLSLSLSSDNPTTIGLQSFKLRQAHHPHHGDGGFSFIHPISDFRDGFGVKGTGFQQYPHDQILVQGQQFHEVVRNSKYLVPAQELLTEFCCLESKQSTCVDDDDDDEIQRQVPREAKNKEIITWGDGDHTYNASGSKNQQSLFGLDLTQLHKRKKNLIALLDELNKRYKRYKDQIKAVARSFEAVAGDGAAAPYTSSASRAISRHFRSLKDGLVDQIKASAVAAAEAEGGGGETTPRLRALDQALRRQQEALQQMGKAPEAQPWRPKRGLPEKSVSVLRSWLFEHFLHPYPTDVNKHILARQTGLSRSQVSNWFINARVRLWKPMVEEMYLEETKDEQLVEVSSSATDNIVGRARNDGFGHGGRATETPAPNPRTMLSQEDQKPTLDQSIIDFESLPAIISTANPIGHHRRHQEGFGGPTSMETLDFSSYNNHMNASREGFSLSRSVSLTLGLQQDGGAGALSLASLSPVGPPGSSFYPGAEYSLLDGDEDQSHINLPYKNLMGAQLLHDFA